MHIQTCEQGRLTEFEVRPKTKVYSTWNAVVEWSLPCKGLRSNQSSLHPSSPPPHSQTLHGQK